MQTTAVMDSTIACWDAKYAYWYQRPFEGDPGTAAPVERPNFPSYPAYPSAHGCATAAAAAAAGVLAAFFPAESAALAVARVLGAREPVGLE